MRVPAPVLVVTLRRSWRLAGTTPSRRGPEPQVRLELGSPADGSIVRTESVEIRGTVQPRGAHVQVLGREVAVDGGSFRAEVPLEPGANLIDISADARGRRPESPSRGWCARSACRSPTSWAPTLTPRRSSSRASA